VVSSPNSPDTCISWQFWSTLGSAIILTLTSCLQAMLKAAATFMFTGNLNTASWASPSYKTTSSLASIPSDCGGFLVSKLTRLIFPIEAAFIPSRPTIAPEGVYILQWLSDAILLSFPRKLFPIRAPMLMIITSFPALRTFGTYFITASGDAASITRSTLLNISSKFKTALPSTFADNLFALSRSTS